MKRILLCLVALVSAGLAGCVRTTATTVTTTGPDYGDFPHLIDYDAIFDRPEGTYAVYLYAPSCGHCAEIKATVLAFADSYAIPIYFLDVSLAAGTGREAFLEATAQTAVGTPCLVLVTAGRFDPEDAGGHLARGATAVLALIETMLAGPVPGWN